MLEHLLQRMADQEPRTITPDYPESQNLLPLESAPLLGITPITLITPKKNKGELCFENSCITHDVRDDKKAGYSVKCGDCCDFQSFNQHGKGAGRCQVGVMPLGIVHWSESLHMCEQHQQIFTNG
jgi:hypothetical protein